MKIIKIFEIYNKKGKKIFNKVFLKILSIKNLKNMIVLLFVILDMDF